MPVTKRKYHTQAEQLRKEGFPENVIQSIVGSKNAGRAQTNSFGHAPIVSIDSSQNHKRLYALPDGMILNDKSLGEYRKDAEAYEKIGLTSEACWEMFRDENFPIEQYCHIRHTLHRSIVAHEELFVDETFIEWVKVCVVSAIRRFKDSPVKTTRTDTTCRLGSGVTPADVFFKIKLQSSARGILIHRAWKPLDESTP